MWLLAQPDHNPLGDLIGLTVLWESWLFASIDLLWKEAIKRVLPCRREMRDMMHRLIDSFSPVYLQPMTLSELYQRMCMNLVSITCHLPVHSSEVHRQQMCYQPRTFPSHTYTYDQGRHTFHTC